jgi:hypothetical protein
MRWDCVDREREGIHPVNMEDFRLRNIRMRDIPINQRARSVLIALPRKAEYVFTGKYGRPFTTHAISSKFKKYV